MKTRHTIPLQLVLSCATAIPALVLATPQTDAIPDKTLPSPKQQATAARHVKEAVAIAQRLDSVERMRGVLQSAKGVFIVPNYGRAALAVGASGGTGLLLARRADGSWSEPVFYTTGAVSVGVQAGAQKGAFVLLLNNDRAVNEFLKNNNFSMNAKAGLTLVNWNKMVQGTVGTGDVLAWSDTKGLFGDLATVELNDVRFSQKLTTAYYGQPLSPSQVINGSVANPESAPLLKALSAPATTAR